jgi:hypothetical protein
MRGPVSDYDRNNHAGGAVLGCFFPDEMTRRRGCYLATGEEQGLTEGDNGETWPGWRGGERWPALAALDALWAMTWTALQPQLAMTETRRGSPREARDEGGDAGVVRCHEAAHLHRLGRARQPLDDREDENEPRINAMTTSDEFDDGNSPASS